MWTFFTLPSFPPIRAHWEVHPEYDESSFFRFVQTDGDPLTEANGFALQPMRHDGKTQMYCCLVQGPVSAALYPRISHLCVDGGDGKYLLTKLVQAYNPS